MTQRVCKFRKPAGFIVCAAAFLCMSPAVYAQADQRGSDYSQRGISDLVAIADAHLKRGDYRNAIPPLQEVVLRLEVDTLPEMMPTLQNSRFELVRAYYRVGQGELGMGFLERYLESEPRGREVLALQMMAQGFYDQQKWDKLVEVATRLIKSPSAGADDIVMANMMAGQAYFRLKNYKDAAAPLAYAARRTRDKRARSQMELMLVRSLVETGNYRELFGWLPRLYRTKAKFDIVLNVTLMDAGKQRFEADDYLNALLLYRMVLPREVMLEYQRKNVAELNRDLAVAVRQGITDDEKAEREQEIVKIEEAMATLEGLPAYEDEVTFRIGQIYAEVKRYWEAYTLFDKLYKSAKNQEIGDSALLKSVLLLYDLGDIALAESRAMEYLDRHPDGRYTRTLLSVIMRNALRREEREKVIDFKRYLNRIPPSEDSGEMQLESEMHYLVAFAYLQMKEYALAGEHFGIIVDSYPESVVIADATYYRGMSFMLVADYRSAIDYFLLYEDRYTRGSGGMGEHVEEALFRKAVCYYGLQEVIQAKELFTQFIEDYSQHELISEAYSMRGDIEAATEANNDDPYTLDRAVADYVKALELAKIPTQASYAAFQAAKVYELEQQWEKISELMDYYQELQGDNSDVAQATFWTGKAKVQLGLANEAIDAYVDAIRRYGNDTAQAGVDKIIDELVKLSMRLEEESVLRLNGKINALLQSMGENTERNVLKIRLMIAQAKLNGVDAEIELGKQLLDSGSDLHDYSPISLALLCDAAVIKGTLDQMELIYDYFSLNYPESELLWKAYRLKCHELIQRGNFEGVLDVLEDAQGMFGAEDYMGWAQAMKGDMMLKTEQAEQAFAEYQMIQGVSSWRGDLYARAMLGMGMSQKAMGDLDAARIYLMRTYLLYKGLSDGLWAAKAYLADAEVLLLQGKSQDAVTLWSAMLEDDYVKHRPEADIAREMIKKYGSSN
jgi:TolA-binding protein